MNTLKRKYLTIAAVCLLSFPFANYGCSQKAEDAFPQKAVGHSQEKKPASLIINIDMDNEKRLQSAAEMGYKPWKLKAVDVAEECIINQGIGASSGDCEILSEDGGDAVVLVKTLKDGNFRVHLKRLVKPDGIWTATKVERSE